MPSTPPLLDHPTLQCRLHGKDFSTVTQYRGLKYASISGRWRDSIPVNSLPTNAVGTFDATHFGPSCPQKPGAQAWDLTLVGDEVLPNENGQAGSERFDEFECLHVDVTVPKSGCKDGKPMPVFAWVHGGGLSMGANSWPQYEIRRFIERSVKIGKPVIGVSINYRVGILGFLASKELGITGNYGFKDQVNAFRWIKRHIKGFGGDAENVTACGESAGGISLSTLLCAEIGEGLWERCVVMSGETTLRKPRRWGWHEEMYREQLKLLGLEGLRTAVRVKKLKSMTAEDMYEKLPLASHWCALIDGRFIKDDVNLSTLADGRNEVGKRSWCKEFVVGNTAHDGTILKARILANPSALTNLHQLSTSLLSPSDSRLLLEAYNLDPPSTSSTASAILRDRILTLASELRFHLPALLVHEGWLKRGLKAHRYHFHVPNPITGAFTGLASHELDIAHLLQNWNHLLPKTHREVAKSMADRWIGFMNGEGWANEGRVVVFEEDGVTSLGNEEYDEVARYGRGAVLKRIGGDKLWRLAEAWQGVRPDEDIHKGSKAKL
ncbi:para-nitrobenzyl esterase [Lophiotrema nucula]|uniref:Para-nitrobenzyl esterase n=1 Tax=Lophiotrema nucula TaxID=690887 RepID=A0A6A5YR73_9PLEO|nr:para-nitrobenzyl esterase [Lophiotrema nucula]